MEHDTFCLPEVTISPEEDRAFTAAEALIGYLRICRIKISAGTLEHLLRYLGATEPQLPALFDSACSRGVVTDWGQTPQRESEDMRVRALGAMLLSQMEQDGLVLREHESEVLRLRFGLPDGVPHTPEETARILGISREHVRRIEDRTYRRACRRRIRAGKIKDFFAGEQESSSCNSQKISKNP